jgi:hypothetical protein
MNCVSILDMKYINKLVPTTFYYDKAHAFKYLDNRLTTTDVYLIQTEGPEDFLNTWNDYTPFILYLEFKGFESMSNELLKEYASEYQRSN